MSHQYTRGGFPGRSQRPDGRFSQRNRHVGAWKPMDDDSFGSEDRRSRGRGRHSHHGSSGSSSKHFNVKPVFNYEYRPKRPPPDVSPNSLEAVGSNIRQPECFEASDSIFRDDDDLRSLSAQSDTEKIHRDLSGLQIVETPKKEAEDGAKLKPDFSGKVKGGHMQEESPLPAKVDYEEQAVKEKVAENSASIGYSRHSVEQAVDKPMDDDSFRSEDRRSRGRGRHSHHGSSGSSSKHFNVKPVFNYEYRPKRPPPDVSLNSLEAVGSNIRQPECFEASDSIFRDDDDLCSLSAQSDTEKIHRDLSGLQIVETPKKEAEDGAKLKPDFSGKVKGGHMQEESPLPAKVDYEEQAVKEKVAENSASIGYSRHSVEQAVDKPMDDDSFRSEDRRSRGRGRHSHHGSSGSSSKHFNVKPTSNYVCWPKRPPPDVSPKSLEAVGSNLRQPECFEASDSIFRDDDLHSLSAQSDTEKIHLDLSGLQIVETPRKEAEDGAKLKPDFSGKVKGGYMQEESPLPAKVDSEEQAFKEKVAENSAGIRYSRHSVERAVDKPFDICPPKIGTLVKLKPSLLVKNKQKRNEIKHSMEGQPQSLLRPGMVLLKKYLSISDQVKIVKACRDHGMGPGGFYQPGYRDGARLHLKMMCLGKNWDPDTSKYGDIRSIDGAKPPIIPAEFCKFVSKAIRDSHAFIERNSTVRNVEAELPWMSPNICIVNFYSATGKLGLHQDKDESQESLDKGLPVVSFSIGDSAEFLYGDQSDVEKAHKTILESGDVIIFGGKSRRVFHGVRSIIPDTAPKVLQDETNILRGRLNLTFRQY